MVAQRNQDDGGDDDRDAYEERLLVADLGLVVFRVRQVQAVDHRQTHACQCHRDRQDDGVRVGCQEVDADFADDRKGDEYPDLRDQVRGQGFRQVQ